MDNDKCTMQARHIAYLSNACTCTCTHADIYSDLEQYNYNQFVL